MNNCKEYKIHLHKNAKQFISLPGKIELIASEFGPSAVVVHDNVCHHLYLGNIRDELNKSCTMLSDKIIFYDEFNNLAEFELYLSSRGIYIALFSLVEFHEFDNKPKLLEMFKIKREELNKTYFGNGDMNHRVNERLPYSSNKIRILRSNLYNVITFVGREIPDHVEALFVRNVDTDEILSYYMSVLSKIFEAYGGVDYEKLSVNNMGTIYSTKDVLERVLMSDVVQNVDDLAVVKNMYDIVVKLNGLIELTMS